jgi:hypothetical protein
MAVMIARSKTSGRGQHNNRIRMNRNTSRESSDFALVSSPYHRIIFGLSIADMFQSLAMITGPFMAEEAANTPAKWAIGNVVSCRINGLWFIIGIFCSNLYTCFLCYFCFCKVVRQTTDASFRKQIEWKIHPIILFITSAMSVAALVSKAIHTSGMGNMCGIAAFPPGCRVDPEIYGACDKKLEKSQFVLVAIASLLLVPVCFVSIITLMTNICCYVKRSTTISGNVKPVNNHIASNSTSTTVENGTNDLADLERMAVEAECRKQIMIQASLYVIAYMATNLVFFALAVLVLILGTSNETISMVASFVFPLGGLYNILVYTRPKVIGLRRVHPKYSWLKAFIFVVRAGGIMPAMVVSGTDSKDNEISPQPHDESVDDSQLGYSGLDSIKIPSSRLGMNVSSGICADESDFVMAGRASRLPPRKFYDVAEDIDRALETLNIPVATRATRPDAVGIANATTLPVGVITDLGPLHSSELGAIAEEELSVLGRE